MSRIAIVGPGAIGSVFGARLCALGRHDVTVFVRAPFEKFSIEKPDGEVIEVPANCLTDPVGAGPFEWVILAVKGHQVERVAPWLRALADENTVIAVLQNGVEHVDRVTPYANGAHVLPVVVFCPADRVGPGHVVQNAHATLTVPDDSPGRAFAGLYEGSDIEVETTPDIVTPLWMKLCGNIGSGPATALIGRGRGVIRDPEVAGFCRELVRECAAVGRAEGADLPENIAEKVVERHMSAGMDATTSMLVDRLAGRPIEADAMTGAVVRLGARHGIDTPLNRMFHAMLMTVNVDGEG